MGENRASPLRVERENLVVAIAATEGGLAGIKVAWANAGAPCCPACFGGTEWTRLVRKSERQYDRLRQIDKKLKENK